METTDEPSLPEEMDPTPEGKNTDAADAELQFESPPPASEGEEIEEADAMPQPDVSHPEVQEVNPAQEAVWKTVDPQSVEGPEPMEPIEPVEPMEPMEPESTEATEATEPASPQQKDLPELKAPELSKEAQGPVPKLRNFFRRHAEEGRGHKIGKIATPAPVEIVPEKVHEENGDADDEAVDQTGEQPAEPAVDVPEEQPEELEQPEEAEQPEHLAEELEEQPAEAELADADKAEQSPDQSEAKLGNRLEDTGTLTEDAKVEGQETSRPFIEAEEACVPEVPAESGRASLRSERERRSKSAGPFLAEMPERELARRVWRASAVPRAGGKPREVLTHVPQVPQGRGAPQRRDENRRILRGKNGPRSVSPRDQVASRRTPSAGRGKQAEKEKEPRVWKARKFQPESTAKMPFTRPPPPPPPIEMLPEMTWKPQKAPERVRVH